MDLRIVYDFKPKYCDDEVREMETTAISEKELVQLFYLRHDLMSACLREYRPWRHLGTGACSCFKQDLIKRFVWKRTLRLETIQNVIDTSAQPAISFLLFFPF